jgi:hypothetical protein
MQKENRCPMVRDLRSGVGKSEWEVSCCKGLNGGPTDYVLKSCLFGKVIASLRREPRVLQCMISACYTVIWWVNKPCTKRTHMRKGGFQT